MTDAELKAAMARIEADPECHCFKCHLVKSKIHPYDIVKPKKKAKGLKRQKEADLHAEHGA